jgi:sigma-E factor negative regulatory protein RseB
VKHAAFMHAAVMRWLPLAALLTGLLPAGAGAQEAGATGLADARAWLSRIHAAAGSGNYHGTMVFSAGGALSSSRVWHYCVGDQTYEKLETLDGRQQRIVRHNDAVHTLWPQSRLAVVEKREAPAAWSTTPQRVDPKALEQYELRPNGAARVAGREATVFMLEPRDALRYAQRLWADQATGLMLRADIIGPGPEQPVLESTAFSEIEIGVDPQPQAVLQALRKLDGYRVLRPRQQRTTLEAEGWVLAQPVPGFQLAGCLNRGMATAGEFEPVLQTVFTDGLTHVSVFLEPYRPQRHGREIQARQGATATVTRRRGEHWVTVVGDVPPATLQLFAEALERRR